MFNRKIINVSLVTLTLVLFLTSKNVSYAKDKSFINNGSSWAKEALENANKNELLEDIPGEINPKKDLTRAEMASIMNNIFNSHVESDVSKYTDMKNGYWYYKDMAKAVHMGMFTGYNNMLEPEKAIIREEAFAVISRAFKIKELHGGKEPVGFKDINEVSDWAKQDVYGLIKSGYINGSNGKINPKGNISVEEFLQIIDNIIDQIISKPGLYTEVSKGNIVINKPAVIIKNQTIGGDLIITEGVAEEDMILDNVVVRGNVIARGGELIVKSDSLIQQIYIDKTDGKFRLKVDDPSVVKKVIVNSTSDISGDGNIMSLNIKKGDRTKISTLNQPVVNDSRFTIIYDKRGKEIDHGYSVINLTK